MVNKTEIVSSPDINSFFIVETIRLTLKKGKNEPKEKETQRAKNSPHRQTKPYQIYQYHLLD